MKRFFAIEDAINEPGGPLSYPPQFKIVRRQIAPSSGWFSGPGIAARLVRLRAKRTAA
jgi:hypothetical protein